MSAIASFFKDPKDSFVDNNEKKKKERRRKAKEKEKGFTDVFGRTLLNDPLGKSRSLLQGRPGGAGGGSVLGG